MATYNRNGAIAYAKRWWNDHNPNYPNFDAMGEGISDCANFVSQCMHEGGGMPMKFNGDKYTKWYYRAMGDRSGSWAGAQSLRLFIKKNKTDTPRMPFAFLANNQVGTLTMGDIVFHLEGSGDKSKRKADHVAIVDHVSGDDIYVYAHHAPKNNEKWSYALKNTILCHFDGTILTGDSGTGSNPSSWQARYGIPTLKTSNSFNAYAQNMQADLISLGYNLGPKGADGYFGSATTTAVKAFQTSKGLNSDGLVGDITKQALYVAVYG